MESATSPRLDDAAVTVALTAAGIRMADPVRAVPLTGGYSWRTYQLIDAVGASVVLRIAPRGGTLEPYDPMVEARAIEAGHGCVPAPRVLAVERGTRPFGDPYLIQSMAPGRVLRLSAVVDQEERDRYRATFARTLGVLNRDGDGAALGDAATVTEALHDELERMAQRYLRAVRWPRPGFEIGLRWLLTHLPECSDPPAYCHGDYRFGNLTWTAPGQLGAVLDWERAWCGDPMSDVAFSRVYSGWCAVDGTATAAYESAGRVVDEGRVAYAMRFERVRSYTSSLLGAKAFRDGRSADERLLVIGAAGEDGMLGLLDWLAEDEALTELPSAWRAAVVEQPAAVAGEDAGALPGYDGSWLDDLQLGATAGRAALPRLHRAASGAAAAAKFQTNG